MHYAQITVYFQPITSIWYSYAESCWFRQKRINVFAKEPNERLFRCYQIDLCMIEKSRNFKISQLFRLYCKTDSLSGHILICTHMLECSRDSRQTRSIIWHEAYSHSHFQSSSLARHLLPLRSQSTITIYGICHYVFPNEDIAIAYCISNYLTE